MKKSLILSSLLYASTIFAGEFYNDVSLGGYHIKDDSNKMYVAVQSAFLSNAVILPPFIYNKSSDGFHTNEQYLIGDGLSNAEWQIFYKNIGINMGYVNINHNQTDGAYMGIVYSDSLFGMTNGAIANESLLDTVFTVSIAPFTTNDLDLMTKFEITQQITKNITLGANYTIFADSRSQLVNSNQPLSINHPPVAPHEEDFKDTKIASIFVKIPF